jgi:RNA polymerase sigma-70 factor (ECF subfamily)
MAMQPAITDAQITSLLPACQRGEAAAVEALYDLYADRLYRYLLARVGDPDAAADLTTELFLRVIKYVGGFRLDRRHPAASFSAWLYRIAANLATDHHRAQRRLPQVSLEAQEERPLPAHDPGPQYLAEQREASVRLSAALGKLSEEQRLVVIAKFGEEMSNAEIADWLGKTEGAVKSLQHRALRTLGRLLGAEDKRKSAGGEPLSGRRSFPEMREVI